MLKPSFLCNNRKFGIRHSTIIQQINRNINLNHDLTTLHNLSKLYNFYYYNVINEKL